MGYFAALLENSCGLSEFIQLNVNDSCCDASLGAEGRPRLCTEFERFLRLRFCVRKLAEPGERCGAPGEALNGIVRICEAARQRTLHQGKGLSAPPLPKANAGFKEPELPLPRRIFTRKPRYRLVSGRL